MTAYLYVEGGGDSKELHIRCREGFRRLLERCGFTGRMPRIVACGSRNAAYEDFKTAHARATPGAYVAVLVDSEDPVADIHDPWGHLLRRDGWPRPAGARDEQAFLMVTSMETWLACDRAAIAAQYGAHVQTSALPTVLSDLEARPRAAVFQALAHATRSAPRPYAKGAESFTLLARLDPQTLARHLPSFARLQAVLDDAL